MGHDHCEGTEQEHQEGQLHLFAVGFSESLGKLYKKWVNHKVVAEGGYFTNVATKFLVSDYASKNVLSAGKLRARGFTVVMSDEGNDLVHPNFAYKIPPFLYNNSFYLKVMEEKCMDNIQEKATFVGPGRRSRHS